MQRRKNDERSNFNVHNRGTTEWNKCQTMSVKCILSLARTKDASQKNEKRRSAGALGAAAAVGCLIDENRSEKRERKRENKTESVRKVYLSENVILCFLIERICV